MTTTSRKTFVKQGNQAAQQHQQSGREYGLETAMTQMKRSSKQRFSTVGLATVTLGLLGMSLSLTGCGLSGGSASTAAGGVTGASTHGILGNVHGGQQPVTGATIQLYTVGTAGPDSAATALITSITATTSDGSGIGGNASNANNTLPPGNFTITGLYSCSNATQVYLVATGGKSGGSSVNSAISLMAPLGSCATLIANPSEYVQINEVTTVASAYALAPFMTDYAHVGANGSNPTGLLNAVANFNSLANVSTGLAGGASLASGTIVPTTEINTLGDIIAACINNSSLCSTLTTATGANDTIGMVLAIAKNPGSATFTALQSLSAGTGAPFQPTLATVPNDWSMQITYAPGTLSSPYGIAIDASGNAWVTNAGGSSVVELTPTGAVGTTLTTSPGPQGIAIDQTGNVWVATPATGTVRKFASGAGAGTPYTVGTGPVAIAIDSAGTAWVANQVSNSISSVTSAGAVTSYSSDLGLNGPTGIAVDSMKGVGGGNIYVANSGGGNVVKLTHAGAAASGSPFTDYALQGATAVALDSNNSVYVLGSTTGPIEQAALSQFSSAGVAASYSPVSGGVASGINAGLAVGGVNTVFATTTSATGNLLTLTLGSSTGYQLGSLNAAVGVAIDASGDVWTANSGDNTVSKFIGLTSPAVTPLAANVGP